MKKIKLRVSHKYSRLFVSALLIAGILTPYTLGRARISDFAGPLFLSLLLGIVFHVSLRSMGQALVTPMLPFVMVMGIAAFFQDDISRSLWLLGIVSSYVLARLLRQLVAFNPALLGLALVGVSLGLVYQASKSPLGSWEIVNELESNLGGKNPAGWSLVFGLVALFSLLISVINQRAIGLAVVVSTAIFIGLLVFSDSLAALVAGIAVVLISGFVSIVRSPKNQEFRAYFRPYAWIFAGTTAFLGLLVALANTLPGVFGENFGFLRRDFSTLTGREFIWNCYLDAVSRGSYRPWEDTVSCVPFQPAHLHSIFLESHLIGGWALVISLLFGLFGTMIWGLVRAITAHDLRGVSEGLFAAGVGVSSLAIGAVESFIFYPVAYGALILFFASPTAGNIPYTFTKAIGQVQLRLSKGRTDK